MQYAIMKSPIGPLTIAGSEMGLHSISFGAARADSIPVLGGQDPRLDVVKETIRQLQAYFAKTLVHFDLPLKPQGTPFQMGVWRELQNIPYGTVISYGELARRIGKPKASRAVGAANGSNPIPIIIPCHRVIGSNGKIAGYAGGVQIKETLLELERIRLL